MKLITTAVLFALSLSVSALAQTSPEIEKALLAAPAQMKDGATVIKWKSDFTFDTLKKARTAWFADRLAAGDQPFSVECTSIANLERVAVSLKTEASTLQAERRAAFEALEKPASGRSPSSIHVLQPDGCQPGDGALARNDLRPGSHDSELDGYAGNCHPGRRLDYECRLVCGPPDDAGALRAGCLR
jgi:hypothetical protein